MVPMKEIVIANKKGWSEKNLTQAPTNCLQAGMTCPEILGC